MASLHKQRSSSTTAGAPTNTKPPTTLHPECTIAEKAMLMGSHRITVAAHAVLHPFSRIDATHGPVFVDEGAVVWEKAHLGAQSLASPVPKRTSPGAEHVIETRLGRFAVLEATAVLEAGATIEECAVVEVSARVCAGALVGKHARLTPMSVLHAGENLAAYTVLFPPAYPAAVSAEQQQEEQAPTRYGETQQTERLNITLRNDPRLREMSEAGHRQHIEMMRRLVKSGSAVPASVAAAAVNAAAGHEDGGSVGDARAS